MWWSALPNPLRLLETDNPEWETSNIKYRGLNWLFWNPVYNSRTNALTNNSSVKPLQARSWPCLQTSLLIFLRVWETRFLIQENTLSQHMASLAIRCWADVWRVTSAAEFMLYIWMRSWRRLTQQRRSSSNWLQGEDIRRLGGICLVVSSWDVKWNLSGFLFL